jgi:hypothetical protein
MAVVISWGDGLTYDEITWLFNVVDELYRAMVRKLDAHAVLGHPMVNAEFVNAINALVEKYTVCD